MGDEDYAIVSAAIETLVRAGHCAVPALLRALKNPNSDVRHRVARVLYFLVPASAGVEAALKEALRDPNREVRKQAYYDLGIMETLGSWDTSLQYEIDERNRERRQALHVRQERARLHAREEILSAIPPDADHRSALELKQTFSVKTGRGESLVTLHHGRQRAELLRIWKRVGPRYLLLQEFTPRDDASVAYFAVQQFRYRGEPFIHVMMIYTGTGYSHEDTLYRVLPAGDLEDIEFVGGGQPPLNKGEGIWKGEFRQFSDDSLRFEYGIWSEKDANCCPTAGWVTGQYKIVGNKMMIDTVKRLPARKD